MGVKSNKASTAVRNTAGSVRDWFASQSSATKTAMGVGTMVVIIGLLLTTTIFLSGRAPKTDTTAYQAYLVDTGGQDLPAPTFTGWVGELRESPAGIAELDESITEASPAECVPGGELHRKAQEVSRDWSSNWSGQTLTLVSYNAQMNIDIANPEMKPMSAIDEWTAACPRITFDKDGIHHVQKVQVLPVEEDYWGMDDNRVYVVTLTRLQDGRNLGTTSTLYAVSRYRDLTMEGALTIRGSVTDNAISTLNLLWERQMMKAQSERDA
ncbi:MAG: hypothetical protein DI630_24350 [Gordonia sp. (in: high G+C Gram-positive bacteria)]|nr:MAG: hypothetical protein DI630_24350 [Gordonia sp. (in: high G+C Gram-positive bacteria)]